MSKQKARWIFFATSILWVSLLRFIASVIFFLINLITIEWWSTGATQTFINWLLGILWLLSLVALTPLGIVLIVTNSKGGSKVNKKASFVWFWLRFMSYFIDTLINVTVIGALINLVLYFNSAQTIGYKIIGAKIYWVKNGALQEASGPRLLWRSFAKIISALPLYLWFLRIGWDKQKQWLHDHLVWTVVVQEYEPKMWLVVLLFILSIVILSILYAAGSF